MNSLQILWIQVSVKWKHPWFWGPLWDPKSIKNRLKKLTLFRTLKKQCSDDFGLSNDSKTKPFLITFLTSANLRFCLYLQHFRAFWGFQNRQFSDWFPGRFPRTRFFTIFEIFDRFWGSVFVTFRNYLQHFFSMHFDGLVGCVQNPKPVQGWRWKRRSGNPNPVSSIGDPGYKI